jgi:hypothetical protein
MGSGQLLKAGTKQLLKSGIVGLLFLGLIIVAPAPASASNMWQQQAILLIHIPLGGGLFFTTNYVFTANGGPAMVNVRCFNDNSQRVGPPLGVTVELNATGQLRHLTPANLQVLADPLFTTTGIGWCWANNTVGVADYNVQITIGATSDLGPNGILNSPSSTAVGTNTGLAGTSRNFGGIPNITTSGGVENYAFIVNPTNTFQMISLQLYNAAGIPLGPALVRNLSDRNLEVLQIPQVFGVAALPTGGSVTISTIPSPLPLGTPGYTGWFLQPHPTGNRMVFTAIGLEADQAELLLPAMAPGP